MTKDFKPEIELETDFDLQLFAEEEGGEPADSTLEADTGEEPIDDGLEGADDGGLDDTSDEDLSDFELRLKYNSEEKVITDREKATELAQKGMNYDKIKGRADTLEQELEEYKQYKDDPLRKWAKERMEGSGFDDPNEFLKAVDIQERQKKYSDNGLSPKQAREEAERDYRLEQLENKLKEKEQVEQEQQEMQDFLEWYSGKMEAGVFDSDLDPESIPKEVWEANEKGVPLKQAYMEHALEDLAKNGEQKVLKKMQENKQSSTGSTQDNTQTEDTSEWTVDYVNKMVEQKGDAWVEENFDKIEESGYFSKVT